MCNVISPLFQCSLSLFFSTIQMCELNRTTTTTTCFIGRIQIDRAQQVYGWRRAIASFPPFLSRLKRRDRIELPWLLDSRYVDPNFLLLLGEKRGRKNKEIFSLLFHHDVTRGILLTTVVFVWLVASQLSISRMLFSLCCCSKAHIQSHKVPELRFARTYREQLSTQQFRALERVGIKDSRYSTSSIRFRQYINQTVWCMYYTAAAAAIIPARSDRKKKKKT